MTKKWVGANFNPFNKETETTMSEANPTVTGV